MFFPVCYPFAVSVLCRQYSVVSLYMYIVLCGIHVVFVFLVGVFVSLEKQTCFLVVIVFESL